MKLLGSSYQRAKRLFVLAYDNTDGNNKVSIDFFKRYFLPRIKIGNCNIKIDRRIFYDWPINDSINQYDEATKISIEKGDDYTTGCLMVFNFLKKHYRLIAVDFSE